jgi:very-short-patch-repair endonuclease
MWRALRNRGLAGAKFRRQVPIGPYYADFLCHDAKLVVEIDGGQHASRDERARDARFAADGYRIVRFWNNDVMDNIEGVVTVLRRVLSETPSPSRP